VFDKLISTAELEKRLSSPDIVLIDVRHDLTQPNWGEAQYRQAHLPGAIFAHLDRDLSAPTTGRNGRHPLPSPEAAAATFGRLSIDASKQVIAYDQGPGVYASRLWWMLRWLGHEAAAVLDGGYAKWMREGRVVSSDLAEPRGTTFVIKTRAPVVDAAAVHANLDSRASVLVDARAPERFRGEVEPIDRVAGHIPGAINRPHAENMSADGTWKSRDTLRAEFDALLGGRPADHVVHYCGSGVSACHNVLAMEIAGLPGARLYPGSWSEWSSDPSRPQARGT
jgi:thiosulfate/3-mercaptopyruvate sulfurtransferase